jgi:hypothetical protein
MQKKEENKILAKLLEVCQRANADSSDYQLLEELYLFVSSANIADDQRDREVRRMIDQAFSSKESE